MNLSVLAVTALIVAAMWVDVPTVMFPAAVIGATLVLAGTMALEERLGT